MNGGGNGRVHRTELFHSAIKKELDIHILNCPSVQNFESSDL